MASEVFPGLKTLYFHPETPSQFIRKKFQNRFWGLEKMIFEISNFHQFEAAGLMKKWTDLNFIAP